MFLLKNIPDFQNIKIAGGHIFAKQKKVATKLELRREKKVEFLE